MGFMRQQQERLALRYLRWQYQRQQLPPPSESELQDKAAEIVAQAHLIARRRGRNVLAIIKEMVEDIRKGKG